MDCGPDQLHCSCRQQSTQQQSHGCSSARNCQRLCQKPAPDKSFRTAKGTNDAEQAAKDDKGQPVSNSARNLWVTETALSTALNVSYMAEQLSLFSLVVGIALLLAGVGFIVLSYAALRPPPREPAASLATT